MSQPRRLLGVVMDPIDTIKPKKDSTLAMMLAAQRAGWELVYLRQQDQKLLASVASDKVGWPFRILADRRRDLAQAFVAGQMAISVVVEFEVVNINK